MTAFVFHVFEPSDHVGDAAEAEAAADDCGPGTVMKQPLSACFFQPQFLLILNSSRLIFPSKHGRTGKERLGKGEAHFVVFPL